MSGLPWTASKLDIASGTEIAIKKAPHYVRLIRLKEYDFFEILRNKLHLGARPLSNNNA
jgi:NAD kinase